MRGKMLPALVAPVIGERIHVIRGQRVMLDQDLAELYSVETQRLNEQVKRNLQRFPKGFMFQLTSKEFKNLKSQIATSSWGGRHQLMETPGPKKRKIGFGGSE